MKNQPTTTATYKLQKQQTRGYKLVIIGLLLLAIFQVNSKAHGQVFFGGKVGLNILPAPEVAIEHPGLPVIGYQFGTTMEFVINEKLSLECEFNYSEKRVNGYVPFRNTKYFELPLNLLTTPKALRFFIGDRPAGIYLKTGIYGGQLRSIYNLDADRATFKERFDWGINVGIGFTCRFTKSKLMIDFSYSQGILKQLAFSGLKDYLNRTPPLSIYYLLTKSRPEEHRKDWRYR